MSSSVNMTGASAAKEDAADAASSSGDAQKASTGLESYFLRQLLSEVRSSSEGSLLDGGFAGSTFHEMLDGQLADSMAKAGGLGIGKMVQKALDKSDDDPSATAIKVLQHRSK
jgi:Rod binding domain-containing protein